MNLTELFEVQRKLDAEIERKHPTAPGEDRLAKRILALQVELGELANEWRGFKFWSTDKRARTDETIYCICDEGVIHWGEGSTNICDKCDGDGIKGHENLVLNEYVDCLHFILSIGLAKKLDYIDFDKERKENLESGITHKDKTITNQFINVFYYISDFENYVANEEYIDLVLTFMSLGEMLGFTWEQVTDAYMSKNEINHQRQESGY